MLKKLTQIFLLSTLSSVLFVAHGATSNNQNRIEAIANEQVILKSDLDQQEKEYTQKLKAHLSADQIPDRLTIRKQALDNLINRSLVEQLASRMGVTISDVQLDQMMATAAKMNGITVSKLYEESFKREGLTPQQTREKFRKEALISEFQNINVRRRINISNQELDQMVEILKKENGNETTYHIADIFLRLENSMSPEEIGKVEDLAKSLVKRIKAGENFAKLAAQYSADDKAGNGGDWGIVNVHSLPTMFADNIIGAKSGDLIGPVRIDSGFLIIKVIEVKGSKFAPDMKVHLRHILIKPTLILSDSKVVDQMKQIRQRILDHSSDFASEARKFSEDPSSAVNGGDLGLMSLDLFDPLFSQNVSTLQIGEISEPFKSSYGWHIAQLVEKKVDPNSNSALKDQAFQLLFSKRYNEELILWFNDLRNNSYIKIMDPKLANLPKPGVVKD